MWWDSASIRIHGRQYGVAYLGRIIFRDDPRRIKLSYLGLRVKQKFFYEYDFNDQWRHLIRVEAILPSAVDQVLSKRFVKKQQMSWSCRGAHLLLQVRTRVLNEELRDKFDEWYPGLGGNSEECARAA